MVFSGFWYEVAWWVVVYGAGVVEVVSFYSYFAFCVDDVGFSGCDGYGFWESEGVYFVEAGCYVLGGGAELVAVWVSSWSVPDGCVYWKGEGWAGVAGCEPEGDFFYVVFLGYKGLSIVFRG